MRDFRDAYQEAMNELPKFSLDADKVSDRLHHQKMVAAARRKALVSVATAASVFLLFGLGTAVAVNYRSSQLEVNENGFAFVGGEAAGYSPGEGAETPMLASLPAGNGRMALPEEEFQGEAGAARKEDADEAGAADEGAVGEECEQTEYDTIEAFLAAEQIPIAIPDLESLGDGTVEFQNVVVTPDLGDVHVSLGFDDGKVFFMDQQDNRGSLGYASGYAYPGKMVNERLLTNDQGFAWTLADCERDGEVVGICAAISVNERDITMSFFGYENVEVDAILKHLDFSIYFEENF